MKVVHNKLKGDNDAGSWLEQAKAAEQQNDWETAAKAYEKIIIGEPRNEQVYRRLMMLYRRLKEYKKELKVIETAISEFSAIHSIRKAVPNAVITRLSKAIAKSTGLLDKKNKPLYSPEPVGTWQKRREIVRKKIKKI